MAICNANTESIRPSAVYMSGLAQPCRQGRIYTFLCVFLFVQLLKETLQPLFQISVLKRYIASFPDKLVQSEEAGMCARAVDHAKPRA